LAHYKFNLKFYSSSNNLWIIYPTPSARMIESDLYKFTFVWLNAGFRGTRKNLPQGRRRRNGRKEWKQEAEGETNGVRSMEAKGDEQGCYCVVVWLNVLIPITTICPGSALLRALWPGHRRKARLCSLLCQQFVLTIKGYFTLCVLSAVNHSAIDLDPISNFNFLRLDYLRPVDSINPEKLYSMISVFFPRKTSS